MISAICWVPKGAAKEFPDVVEQPPTDEKIEELRKLYDAEISKNGSGNGEEEEEEPEEEDNDEEMVDKMEESSEDAVKRALAVADALGSQKAKQNIRHVDDISHAFKELDMDHYDDDADEGLQIFETGSLGNCYYPTNYVDPYLQNADDDEEGEEEIEDRRIKSSDLLILCARNIDDYNCIELWVYEEPSDELDIPNMYVNREIALSAFPLSLAWLDCNPKGGDKGNFVAVGSMQPEIEIWDIDAFEPEEAVVVLGGVDKNADPDTSKNTDPDTSSNAKKKKKKKKKSKKNVVFKEGSHTDAVLGLAWNKEYRNVLASAGADKTVKIWDIVQEKCEHSINHHEDKVQSVAWNPNKATILLSGSFDRSVCMVDMRAPTHPGIRWHVQADVETVAWDPHTEYSFVVSVEDGTVQAFDIRTAASSKESPTFTLHAHDKAVCAVSYNPAAPNLLATGSTDKMVKLWDITNNQPACIASTNLKIGGVFSVTFLNDSPFLLASGGEKGKLNVWDILENAEVSKRFGKFKKQCP